jgi:RNA-directed DNA polymerase
MHDCGKSDNSILPVKSANKGCYGSAEWMEGRELAKGNSAQETRDRTQIREDLQHDLMRVREAASRDRNAEFTALWHHVYNVDRLRDAYFRLKRESAPGVDGQTWECYGMSLDANLRELSERLKRGAYRAKPVRRVYIPKADGRLRPIGVPALEDKIVQRTAAEVLSQVYEVDFRDFSYGFRPGRSQHDALNTLAVSLMGQKVNWVLDADISGFFDAIDHEWMLKFLKHRITDTRVLRHIKKWLNAGVLEDGVVRRAEEGTPQGGSISPLLANVYLHYALDNWFLAWKQSKATGDVVMVRFADDFIVGFQHRADAEQFLLALRTRLGRFNLKLHPDKTRLIEFGRFARPNRIGRGVGKPETFNFLGFTHICGMTRNGRFQVVRKTMRKKQQSKLRELKMDLRKRLHQPVHAVGKWLKSVVMGHYRYYGVPGNLDAMRSFRYHVSLLWKDSLGRRSQKGYFSWTRMNGLASHWLPVPQIVHPYPTSRPHVTT